MKTVNKLSILGLLLICSNALANGASAEADVKLSPAGDFVGKTSDVSGVATINGDSVEADKIIVKMKNFKTGMAMRDKHAQEKYLETAKFPEAILTKAVGKNGKGSGLLKIKGIEKQVSGTYKIDGKFLKAEFPIKLSDYGITGVKYMGVGVDDEVNLRVSVPTKQK